MLVFGWIINIKDFHFSWTISLIFLGIPIGVINVYLIHEGLSEWSRTDFFLIC